MTLRFILALGSLMATAAYGQSCAGVEAALEKVHTSAFAESVPEVLYNAAIGPASFVAAPDQPDFLNPIMKRAFDNAFEADQFYEDLVVSFSGQCVQQKLSTYEALAGTPLFLTMDRLDRGALSPSFPAERNAFVSGLAQDPPSQERLSLLERLDRAQGATQMAMTIVESSYRAMQQAQRERIAPADLKKARQQIAQQMLDTSLYLYRNVVDEDLQGYVQLLEQPSVRWFYQTYYAAVSEVMQRHLALAARQMTAEFSRVKTARR